MWREVLWGYRRAIDSSSLERDAPHPRTPAKPKYLKHLPVNLVILVYEIFHHSFAERTGIPFLWGYRTYLLSLLDLRGLFQCIRPQKIQSIKNEY